MQHRNTILMLFLGILTAACGSAPVGDSTVAPVDSVMAAGPGVPADNAIKTVFLIVMENHNWNEIEGSSNAPYINGTLLAQYAHAEKYMNPPGLHPSEPNYIWLEAGQTFGVDSDDSPSLSHHISSPAHLTRLMNAAGISWKSYQEDISGDGCPLASVNHYAPKHNPMIFFDDVTGLDDKNAWCQQHVRPFGELSGDLSAGKVAAYNFITPNLCNDMHDSCSPMDNDTKQGDTWLASEIPMIMASDAYKNGGLILITWDEGEGTDGPIGLIAIGDMVRPGFVDATTSYTHSSTLRTVEEIFGLSPLLGDAANANDLSPLFAQFP
jgi:hypothetical protein